MRDYLKLLYKKRIEKIFSLWFIVGFGGNFELLVLNRSIAIYYNCSIIVCRSKDLTIINFFFFSLTKINNLNCHYINYIQEQFLIINIFHRFGEVHTNNHLSKITFYTLVVTRKNKNINSPLY